MDTGRCKSDSPDESQVSINKDTLIWLRWLITFSECQLLRDEHVTLRTYCEQRDLNFADFMTDDGRLVLSLGRMQVDRALRHLARNVGLPVTDLWVRSTFAAFFFEVQTP